jgi:hypothetical protein
MRYSTSSKKTAIKRNLPSAPLKAIIKSRTAKGDLNPDTDYTFIDHGCGHGSDVNHLIGLGFTVQGYDPNHQSGLSCGDISNPDYITSTYVMNVIHGNGLEQDWLEDIISRMGYYSICFITVRTDIKQDGFTSRGTFQKTVNFPSWCNLECKGSGFRTYRFTIESLRRLAADRYALHHFGRYPENA